MDEEECEFCGHIFEITYFISCPDCNAEGCVDCIEDRHCCNGEGVKGK